MCLRIYINELYNLFFTEPNSIILLYDKTSEESFRNIESFYEDSIKNKKYENIKFILIGNKKDLISEVEEAEEHSSKRIQIQIKKVHKNKQDKNKEARTNKEDKNKDYRNNNNEDKMKEDNKNNEDNNNENENFNNKEIKNSENKDNKENKEDKEDKENKEGKEDEQLLNFGQKIEKFCKEKKILHKEISGLTGEGVMELLEEIVLILFKDIKTIQEDEKQLSNTASFSKNIENELNLSTRQSYHSDDYMKEINKINKRRKFLCCYSCNIF